MIAIVLAPTGPGIDPQEAYEQAQDRIERLLVKLALPSQLQPADINPFGRDVLPYKSNFAKEDFENAVRKCVEYIEAGDIFQVVISQRLQVGIQSDPFEIYRTLRVVNPSPFMFFLRTGGHDLGRKFARDHVAASSTTK